jgi:hypothetical protein
MASKLAAPPEKLEMNKPAAYPEKLKMMELAAYPEKFDMSEVEVEVAEDDDFMFEMEEDPDMYAAAGLPPPTSYVSTSKPMDPETAIKNVMKSVAEIKVPISTSN